MVILYKKWGLLTDIREHPLVFFYYKQVVKDKLFIVFPSDFIQKGTSSLGPLTYLTNLVNFIFKWCKCSSPHVCIESRTVFNRMSYSVIEYSTRGGISAYTLRLIHAVDSLTFF